MGGRSNVPSLGARTASIGAAVVLGALFARTLLQLHAVNLAAQGDSARRIWEGHPYSSALQARLLGPLLVVLTEAVTGRDWQSSYEIVLVVMAVAVVVTMTVALGHHAGNAASGLRRAALGTLLVLLFQDGRWLHLWDLLDLVFMTLFAAAVFSGAGLRVLVPLFLVELCNRESAVFIPLWIALSALPTSGKGAHAWNPKRSLIGASGVVFGLVAVSSVRAHLFHGALAPHRRTSPWGNHLTLHHNAADFLRTLEAFDVRALALYFGVLCGAAFVVRARSALEGDLKRVPLLLLCMAGSVALFGLILEARSWLFIVPFLLFLDPPELIHTT